MFCAAEGLSYHLFLRIQAFAQLLVYGYNGVTKIGLLIAQKPVPSVYFRQR